MAYNCAPLLGYIKDFEVEDPHRVGKITVQLLGRINDCRAISYRQDIKAQNIENYAKSTLPTRQVCVLSFDHLHFSLSVIIKRFKSRNLD